MCPVRSLHLISVVICLACCSAAQTAGGQPVVNLKTSPQYQDAHYHDTSGDMSQAINATLTSDCVLSSATGSNQGCAIKAGYPGLQVWSINPFPAPPSGPNGGDVDLCSAGLTDIRASTTIILTDGLHLHGCGETTPPGNVTSNYNNTIIRACNPAFLSGSTYGTACSPAFAVNVTQEFVASVSCTATSGVCTVVTGTSNQLQQGQDVFTPALVARDR